MAEEERVYYVPTTAKQTNGAVTIIGGLMCLLLLGVLGYVAIRAADTFFAARKEAPAKAAPAPAIAPPAPAVVPAQPVPVEHVVQYEALPPVDVPIEDVQPKAPVVQVQRGETETTIIKTVPVRPSGPPIVIDKGVKRRSAP